MRNTLIVSSASLLLIACGGSAEPTDSMEEGAHHEGGEAMAHQEATEEGAPDDHGELPAGLQAFHDAFAPIWHEDPSPERAERACAAAPELDGLAPAAESDVPGTDSGLPAAVDGLEAACADGADPQAVDAAMVPIHDSFHALIEANAGHDA